MELLEKLSEAQSDEANNAGQEESSMEHPPEHRKDAVAPKEKGFLGASQALSYVFVLLLSITAVITLAWTLMLTGSSASGESIDYRYIGPLPGKEQSTLISSNELPSPSMQCERIMDIAEPEIAAHSYIAVFADSFTVAFERNADERFRFASIVKLLGAIVVAEEYDTEEMIGLVEPVNAEGNGMDLEVGEKASVREMLAAALVGSRNDAMYALAQNYPGGLAGFVERMRSKAIDLGMQNTSVENVIGLDGDGQYSSARDIALLMVAVMRHPEIADLLGCSSYTVVTSYGRRVMIWTTNSLLGKIEGVVAGKTGYTWGAGLSLVEYVDGDPDFVTVVFNAEDRYVESERLIEAVRDGCVCR